MSRAGTEYFTIRTVTSADRSTRVFSTKPGSNASNGKRRQHRLLDVQIVTDRVQATVDATVQVSGFPADDPLVQLIEGLHLRHRGEPGAAEPSDLAFHTALLVRPLDPGMAVERVEAVVGAEQHPAWVLRPSTPRPEQDLRHGGGEVVVADVPGRDPTEGLKRFDVVLQECFLPARRIDPVDRGPGVGQAVHEQVALGLHPVHDHPHLAEVDLRLHPRRVFLRDHRHRGDLAVLDRDLRAASADVVAHRRIRHNRLMLVQETGMDPAGCVPLLARRVQVSDEHRVDHAGVWAEFRCDTVRSLPRRRSADANACRTVRRCTPCRRASSRIEYSPTRPSRRIAANNSTRDPVPDTTTRVFVAMVATLARGGARSDRHTTRHADQVGPPRTVTVGPTQAVRTTGPGAPRSAPDQQRP